ncbi:MAG TPA: 50S ribosomal protein L10 [Candidatus Absconditabacterales bacterium]|nr:50S ribosomal protein L10 [Candidatus Absconditabacterales bacterium]HMT26785.1 50S ribosomal protein L10 [Candidatus Absconditabacterales bacterium]
MAITKAKKVDLIANYKDDLNASKNVVILKQFGIPVNTMNAIRKEVKATGSKITVVRKKLLHKTVSQTDLQEVELPELDGSVVAIFNKENEYAALKIIAKHLKAFKKADAPYKFEYVGGWFEKSRKNGEFVKELADLPTKEELIGKLLYMLKYPVQALTSTLDQVSKKK